jgi:hypothetical protein
VGAQWLLRPCALSGGAQLVRGVHGAGQALQSDEVWTRITFRGKERERHW